jgi:hypothetical protein
MGFEIPQIAHQQLDARVVSGHRRQLGGIPQQQQQLGVAVAQQCFG